MSEHAHMRPLHVCVYLGASPGSDPRFLETARAVGQLLAEEDHVLVYGGASVGCMGAIAAAAVDAGGDVIGVIPEVLVAKEVAKRDLAKLHVVPDMHARKALMAELADAFVALPGGLGTLEELFEMATWSMLGIHDKPTFLFDGGTGYWAGLAAFLDHGVTSGFVQGRHRAIFRMLGDLQGLRAELSKVTRRPHSG